MVLQYLFSTEIPAGRFADRLLRQRSRRIIDLCQSDAEHTRISRTGHRTQIIIGYIRHME